VICFDPAKVLEVKGLDPKVLINRNLRRHPRPFWERYSHCGVKYLFQEADMKAFAKTQRPGTRPRCRALFLEYQFLGNQLDTLARFILALFSSEYE